MLPPFLASVPHYLRRLPVPPPRKRRHRKRGKRSGVLVRLRVCLAQSSEYDHRHLLRLPREFDGFIVRCSSEVSWLRSAVPDAGYTHPSRPWRVSIYRRGSLQENLRPVARGSKRTDHTPVRVPLINTRSLTNETFILNDCFSTHVLDFLLLTETWINPVTTARSLSPPPPRCSFLITRTSSFDIISTNGHCPRVLFSTINSVVSPHSRPLSDATVSTCEDFLRFFVDKVMSVRALSSGSIRPDQTSLLQPHTPQRLTTLSPSPSHHLLM
ncbi:uncharacterized protein LOC121623656 [Chelmon rostratus]|uniref:uncharacterized protein LOC121623656 n=1 Tax=Chelmon rostratus TaxID=109905 RepID=UPI001BE54B9D|nr:uncharacterized protein LOC121623656 [Chelmon rostratus]XP_041816955.1 uncharacterized protein LOC121623656 [Chelmon rostratus]